MTAPTVSDERSCGGRLVAADGREMPLKEVLLKAYARAGLAQVVLEQRFANPHAEPLEVVYSLPLPHDGAVSGFAFRIGERRVVGEVDRREKARERYDEALMQGRTASLLEQERGSLFTQTVGNVPPDEEVVVEITIDQPLAWLDEGAWEWRFPTAVGPRYLGGEGRTPDADRVHQDLTQDAGPRLRLELSISDELSTGGSPFSPSHGLDTRHEEGAWRTSLDGGDLDRDVVVRWPVAAREPGLDLDCGRATEDRSHASATHGLLTVVPPRPDGPLAATARDLVLLIDTSGSMNGAPLEQAKRIAAALVDSLGDEDTLEMIEFSSRPGRWQSEPVRTDTASRRAAAAWIARLSVGGCTEMTSAVQEALRPLREDTQRQVVLITDGYIGFESEVVRAIRDELPAGSRLHGVGVGPAANRSLIGPVARAGRGVEALVGLHEGVEGVLTRLLARTVLPLVTELKVEGEAVLEVSPKALPDLFAGAPARIALRLRPEGGRLVLRGKTADGDWMQELDVPACAAEEGSPATARLFARERVEDLEIDLAAGADSKRVDAEIELLGVDYQIATRLTSWVAISEEPGIDPRDPVRRVRQPQQLPQGLSAEGFGLRRASPTTAGGDHLAACRFAAGEPPMAVGSAIWRQQLNRDPAGPGAPPRMPSSFSGDEERHARPSEPRLRASVRRHADGRLVLEILVEDAPFEWKAPRKVRLHLANGQPVKLLVDAEATTRSGFIEPGATIRLVLDLPSDELPAPPSHLMLKTGYFGRLPVPIES